MRLSLQSCGAESSCRVMLTCSWWVWFKFTGRRKHHLQNIFSQRCSSCFSACQDRLGAHYKDSPATIHISQRLPCLLIKLEAWVCSMCKHATTVMSFKADAGRMWGSFCIMPFNYDGRCWHIFVRQNSLNTQLVATLGERSSLTNKHWIKRRSGPLMTFPALQAYVHELQVIAGSRAVASDLLVALR